MTNSRRGASPGMGLWGAVAIGVGGMVGGGIFAVLGLSVQISHGGAPLSFLIAGAVALLTAHSYAALSGRYPSRGGTVTFLNRAFGTGPVIGTVNVLLWLSYVIMLALYASAFGSYAASFLPTADQSPAKHLCLTGALVAITGLNVAKASAVARAERVIVAVKLAILLLFVAVGWAGVSSERLSPAHWASPLALTAGGMIIFLAYEGFELIANAAEDVSNPVRTLARAYYISVGFVIVLYVAVAIVSVGSVPLGKLVSARDYALAEAARPELGAAGFALIAVAAMLSTASAINATLYGSARLSYVIATSGELPDQLERPVWHRPIEGLLITCAATIAVANAVDIEKISTMGSAGFLIIFAVVNVAAARTSGPGQRRTRLISWTAAGACAAALAALLARSSVSDCLVLGVMLALAVGIEGGYRLWTRGRPERT